MGSQDSKLPRGLSFIQLIEHHDVPGTILGTRDTSVRQGPYRARSLGDKHWTENNSGAARDLSEEACMRGQEEGSRPEGHHKQRLLRQEEPALNI